ncbi:MAG: hypothetical protein ACK4JF_07980 [Methylohalobius sp.]
MEQSEFQAGDEVKTTRQVYVKVKEFKIPPVRDGLVLGRKAQIGCYAIRKALHLLVAAPFVHLELEDEVISDLVVRESVLRRFPKEQLIAFVLAKLKPLMGEEEILELEIDTEVLLESRLICQDDQSPKFDDPNCP